MVSRVSQLQALLDPGSPVRSLGSLPTTPTSQYCLLLPCFKNGPPSLLWQAGPLQAQETYSHIYVLSANTSEGESQWSSLAPSQTLGSRGALNDPAFLHMPRPNQVIVSRRMGHCGWPTCPSQRVGPPDARPTIDKKWKRIAAYVRQTQLNSSLTRFLARFEGRTLGTPTVKGWTELGKETEECEGGSGRNKVFKGERSSTR